MAYIIYCWIILFAFLPSVNAEEIKLYAHAQSGGIILNARAFARYLPKYLPNTNVVIQVIPGAAGINEANYLYNVSKRDGTEIGTLSPNIPMFGIFGGEHIHYDVSQFNWLGSAVDGRKEPIIVWSNGQMPMISGVEAKIDFDQIHFIKKLLHLDLQEISGYADQTQVRMAFESGEISVVTNSLIGVKAASPDWLTNPKIKPIFQYGGKSEGYPDVPAVSELIKNKDDAKLLHVFELQLILIRSFVAPPMIPQDKLAKLREAFNNIMQDQDYIEDAEKIGLNVSPIGWEQSKNIIQEIVKSDPKIIERLKSFGTSNERYVNE